MNCPLNPENKCDTCSWYIYDRTVDPTIKQCAVLILISKIKS
jgi:hypothetical protein